MACKIETCICRWAPLSESLVIFAFVACGISVVYNALHYKCIGFIILLSITHYTIVRQCWHTQGKTPTHTDNGIPGCINCLLIPDTIHTKHFFFFFLWVYILTKRGLSKCQSMSGDRVWSTPLSRRHSLSIIFPSIKMAFPAPFQTEKGDGWVLGFVGGVSAGAWSRGRFLNIKHLGRL